MNSRIVNRGQTIIELVVMIGVIVIIVMGLVVASTTSLARGRSSRSRSLGVKYAQEGIELARNLRDNSSWTSFTSTYASITPMVWCVDEVGVWSAAGTCASTYNIASQYRRTVSLQYVSPLVTVVSTVTWREGQSDATSVLQTYLTKWR